MQIREVFNGNLNFLARLLPMYVELAPLTRQRDLHHAQSSNGFAVLASGSPTRAPALCEAWAIIAISK